MDGLTGKDGSFAFAGFPVADSLKFFIQARNKNEKSNNIGVEVEEFKPPVFTPSKQRFMPWYLNSDTTLLRNITTKIVQERGQEKIPGVKNLLEEVVITGKKVVKGSKNLNGPGEADQVLDEKDMAQTPKMSLLDLMRQKVKGFTEGIFPSSKPPTAGLFPAPFFEKKLSYKILDKEVHLIIDGTDVEYFYIPQILPPKDFTGNYVNDRNAASQTDRMEFIKSYLDFIMAEDVKGIEVMYNMEYNMRYKSKFASDITMSLDVIYADFAYVEVTTYSGNGAFMKKIPGVYLYRPMPFAGSATFYRPRYESKNNASSDLRSTIHWEPNIITNKEGKAFVSFYSADRPGTYTIITEGSDMNGNLGSQINSIFIKP